ncbi:unnamed protein product [Victoria cruziana]
MDWRLVLRSEEGSSCLYYQICGVKKGNLKRAAPLCTILDDMKIRKHFRREDTVWRFILHIHGSRKASFGSATLRNGTR